MTDGIPQYYWDSCVFIAYLNEDRVAYGSTIDHLKQLVDEARSGACRLHYSPITIAEINKQKLKTAKYGDFSSFLRDFKGAVVPVTPDPNVMAVAAELRSLEYTKTGGTRKLATPDAIHLASALALVDTYRITLDAFHTFDDGKNSNDLPLLSYDQWCEKCASDPLAQRVIKMSRCKPLHPTPKLPGTTE